MKTIKLIDLFIKIANGEDTPEKIKYDYKVFTHDDCGNEYYICKENGKFLEESFIFENLNEEVEIIEDTPKVGDIEELDSFSFNNIDLTDEELAVENYLSDVRSKINEIIDKINGVNNE